MTEEKVVSVESGEKEELEKINAEFDGIIVDILKAAQDLREAETDMKKASVMGKMLMRIDDLIEEYSTEEYGEEDRKDVHLILGGFVEMFSRIEPKLSEKTRKSIQEIRENGIS